MTKKLYAINTKTSRSCVYVVEAETQEEALQMLEKAGQSGQKLRPIMRAQTSEDIYSAGETNLEELKNALDLASLVPNSSLLVQDNVAEDDIEAAVLRAITTPPPATPDPFAKLISDLAKYIPNDPDNLH
jgi:hypothetical protein